MKYPPTAEQARLSEVFSSLQGEGIRLGERHIFVRFEECHIHCRYCDELGKPGAERSLAGVSDEIRRIEEQQGPHQFVSYTGGEPLLYVKFLLPLMKYVRDLGLRNYLETDGILWKALPPVLELCDCIAMDMKPASVTGEANFEAQHQRFLELVNDKETFVKIVLSKEIDVGEFDRLVEIIRRVRPRTPLVLQPLSGEREGHEDPELMSLLGRLQKRALGSIPNVRITPRFHKIMKIR